MAYIYGETAYSVKCGLTVYSFASNTAASIRPYSIRMQFGLASPGKIEPSFPLEWLTESIHSYQCLCDTTAYRLVLPFGSAFPL